MLKPALPPDEALRLAALRSLEVLDTAPERAYDDLVAIASAVCGTSMGAVTLVDADRQWFKASRGLDVTETPRDLAFRAHAILAPDDVMLVADATLDVRLEDNPFVTASNGIRFYAGVPLVTGDGHAVGTFCVMDRKPRELAPDQVEALRALARQATSLLDLRRVSRALGHQLREREWYEQRLEAYQKELESRNADLEEQTRTDPLTGLANRRAFAVQLAAEMDSARSTRAPLHVAVVDIDHFKMVNDLHGHPEGDRVLRGVADALRGSDAARGRIARFGGEEFVLLMPGIPVEQARLQCEFLRESIAAMPIGLPVTVSIGLATMGRDESPESLVARADAALYEAKRTGRDRVVVAAA